MMGLKKVINKLKVFKRLNSLEKKNDENLGYIKELEILNKFNLKRLKNLELTSNNEINKLKVTLKSVVNIGMDVNPISGNSWAVICIEGKRNVVKFVSLKHKEMIQLSEYIKSFEVSHKIIDTPFELDGMFR